jgi:hypothetical protein
MNLGPVKQAEDPYEAKQEQRRKRYRGSFHAVQVCESAWKFSTEVVNFCVVLVRLRPLAECRCRPYVWRAPGGFSVHLGLHVVRELAAQTAGNCQLVSRADGIAAGV